MSEEKKESGWRFVPQWITFGAVVWGFMFLNGRITGISEKIDHLDHRIDLQGARIDQQGERIDRLYTMFVDLLKEGKR